MNIGDLLQPILKTKTPLKLNDSPQVLPQWDSLAQINIIAAVEDVVGGELSTAEVLSMTSVGAVIEICKARGIDAALNEAA